MSVKFKGLASVKSYGGNYSDANNWHSYQCGHCGAKGTGFVVAAYPEQSGPLKWLICTSCGDGSVLTSSGIIYPPVSPFPIIEGLPQLIDTSYKEAKDCFSFNAYTACELICRKMLMNIAVQKGAKPGASFASYIEYLEENGYVTAPMKDWVKIIKDSGNDATHEMPSPSKDHAEGVLSFTSLLLQLVYGTEHLSKKYAKQPHSS